jgi:adenylosuccinate synthase
MSGTVVLGMQWGDEGKGKITHMLAAEADWVVRFNGGPNAGHTIIHEGRRYGTHLIPAGAFYRGTRCALAGGTVIDLEVLHDEVTTIRRDFGWDPPLLLAENAHLILPYHRILEGLEGSGSRLGTTRRGIGPAYRDKAARTGIRIGDLVHRERLLERLDAGIGAAQRQFPDAAELRGMTAASLADALLAHAAPFIDSIVDVGPALQDALEGGATVLFEGAQGALLDVDFGTYPYVTSSSTTLAGLPLGTGLPAEAAEHRLGVVKTYLTRVGEGPFPTEMADADEAERLRQRGGEFGVTTGRPRRCGWIDLVALRHASRLNRPTALAVTKIDILSGQETVRVCHAYELDGRRTETFPLDADRLARCRPVYETLDGWEEPLGAARSVDALPAAARGLLDVIEEAGRAPASLISVGPSPEETIRRGF